MKRSPTPKLAALVALAMGTGVRCSESTADPGDVTRTVVASSMSQEGWAMNYPKQRKLLFMAGRLWVFYSDGDAIWARSTVDGVSLSDPMKIRDGAVFGHRMGCAFDGVNFHYAFSSALVGENVFYRRGTPQPDGSLVWSTDEQVAFAVPVNLNAMYPKVIVDTGGHPWVSFMLFQGGYMVAPEDALVVRSDATDGTWVTSDGFPFALMTGNVANYPDPVGVALASGDTYWIVAPTAATTCADASGTASGSPRRSPAPHERRIRNTIWSPTETTSTWCMAAGQSTIGVVMQ